MVNFHAKKENEKRTTEGTKERKRITTPLFSGYGKIAR
jgi:hypothetical protein